MISTQTIQSSLSNFLGASAFRTSTATQQQPAAATRDKQRQSVIISLRQIDGPRATTVMTVHGKVDSRNYRSLVTKCEQLRKDGIERLVVDLKGMPALELTGLYALHCIAKIFRGEGFADAEHGLPGLRRIAEENLASGVHTHVMLVVADKNGADKLKQARVDQLFSIHRSEAGALRAFDCGAGVD